MKSFKAPHEFVFTSLNDTVKIKICKYLQPSCFLNDINLTLKEKKNIGNDLKYKIKVIKLLKFRVHLKIFAQSILTSVFCYFLSYLIKLSDC